MCKQNTRYDMVPWFLIVIGVVGLFLGKVECAPEVRQTSFSCANRNPGYYADVTTGCQVYHMCDNVGRQFSYTCPNATLFQQRMLICDHWYMVNCSKAVSYYDANLRIGQKDLHFVDDSEVNAFTRTPRPDLLTAPSTTLEYNTIYRHGEQNLSPTKYVGVESNDENSTDQATYFPPSHWSTEISKPVDNNENRRRDSQNTQQNHQNQRVNYQNPQSNYQNQRTNYQNQRTNYQNQRINDQNPSNNDNQNEETNQNTQASDVQANNQNQRVIYEKTIYQKQQTNVQNQRRISYKNPLDNDQNIEIKQNSQQSNYQNQRANDQNQNAQVTDQTQQTNHNSEDSKPREDNRYSNNGNLQPEYNSIRRSSMQNSSTKGKSINVYSINSRNNEIVNFKSNFKATTPVYPSSVKDTTRTPNNIGLLPPLFSVLRTAMTHKPELQLELLPPKNPQHELILNEEGLFQEHQLFSKFLSTTPAYPSEDELREFEQRLHQPVTVLLASNFDDSGSKGIPINFQSNFKATTPQYPTSVNPTSPEPSDIGVLPPKNSNNKVNFQSTYKATTPNYPTIVEQTSQNPSEAGILPPKEISNETNSFPTFKIPTDVLEPTGLNERRVVFKSNFKATTPQYPSYVEATSQNPIDVGLLAPRTKVVYKSNFKATTPKYPSFVDATSPNPSDAGLLAPKDTVVNFHSDFKATTPNYPKSVVSTSPDPGQAGLLAPQPSNEVQGLNPDEYITDANNFSDNYNQFPFKTLDPTSEYIEEGDLQEIPGIRLSNFMKSFDYKQWQALRQAFRIPEYDFPLDYATRPSYNSVVNSFEPVSSKK